MAPHETIAHRELYSFQHAKEANAVSAVYADCPFGMERDMKSPDPRLILSIGMMLATFASRVLGIKVAGTNIEQPRPFHDGARTRVAVFLLIGFAPEIQSVSFEPLSSIFKR